MAKGVPRRGPTTPDWIKLLIGDAFLDLTKKRGHEPFAKNVRAKLEDKLREEKKLADLPSLRKVQDVLKQTRDGLRRLLKEERLSDAPWCLGSLANFALPSDSLADVLEVWKWSLAIGKPLSVREAQWVGRLRPTAPLDSKGKLHIDWTGHLYAWANKYARRERASEALDITNDTHDLDAQLVAMGAWEWHTAHLVGVFTPPHLLWEENRRISDEEAAIERDSGHHSHLIGGLPHETVESELGSFDAWVKAKHPIAGSGSWWLEMIYPTPEESKVYAYWLRYLSKGPLWHTIPFERQREIARRLREEVQEVMEATQLYRDLAAQGFIMHMGETEKFWGDVMQVYPAPEYSIGPEPGPVPIVTYSVDRDRRVREISPDRQPMPPFFAWKPKDLLKEVGYAE